MSRNTKEVALIQHRSGNLAEMPKALHQAEIGLAKDANRLFIGNAVNTILANRTEFPYQNLEILTEYSDLRDHFRYSYENNITNADGETDRAKLKEFMPIVITCENSFSTLAVGGKITVNDQEVTLTTGDTINQVAEKINQVSDQSNTYASVIQTSSDTYLTIICLDGDLVVNDIEGSTILQEIGFPEEITYDISMPERKVTEKLDDTLHITDFGVKGDGTNKSQTIYNSLIEVYRNYDNAQFFRDVMFPAGTYLYEPTEVESSNTISLYTPFPLISNLHVHGEGIDRTIIKAANNISDNTYILVNGVDDELNPETSENYGNGNYPQNILIEDLTFESGLSTLCKIDCIGNITFNRVKFKGSTNTTLIDIVGKASKYASNITFNECIFEGSRYGIYAETFVENLTITNCLFDSIDRCAIKLGGDTFAESALVKAVNINGNIIKNSPIHWDSSSGYAIEICRNVKWSSIHQTQFDETLFTNWTNNTYPRPYYRSSLLSTDTNFIDTLDPTTDEQKVLRFHFTQPQWEYLDYLVNQQGKKVLAVDKNDADITAPNGLNIKETASTLDIRAVGTDAGDVKVSMNNNSNLYLGSGTDTAHSVGGKIHTLKDIELNNKEISNAEGNTDINLATASNKIIEVKQKTGDTAYETLIDGKTNALVNVGYVKRQIIDTYEQVITYKDLENAVNGELPLITFDPIIYGSDIHLKRITINVRTPFYKTFEFISKATLYTTGYMYYAGDVVRGTVNGTTTYAVVINTHESTDSNIASNDNLQIIPNQPTYSNIKYVNVIGRNSILTQTYSEDFYNANTPRLDYVDIQANNRFGYINCEEFVDGSSYSSETSSMLVSYCDRNYYLFGIETPTVFNSIDLHNNLKATRKYDEGYCYTFEMDRDVNNGIPEQMNPATMNYSGETLKMAFYDKDKTKFENFDTTTRLCPGGKMIVRIEFLREEVEGAE